MFGRKKKNKALSVQEGEKAIRPKDVRTERVLPERLEKKQGKLPDPYFTKLAKWSRWGRNTVTVLLVIFTLAIAFIFSNEITGEKLKLLLRNASFSFPGEEVRYSTVRYDADAEMDFSAYREYFAVATGSSLRLYDHRGNVALDGDIEMSAPTLDAGEDYLLVYDREGKSYLVCNSVAVLYEGSESFPIYRADVCDNGRYMILTSSSYYLCVMKIYNRSFKQIKEISVNCYPISAELSRDGKTLLLLCTAYGNNGRLENKICIYDVSSNAQLTAEIVTDSLPLAGTLTDRGCAVLFEDSIRIYGTGGALRASFGFGGKTPTHYCFGGKLAAVSFSREELPVGAEVLVYDLEGERSVQSIDHTGRIERLDLKNDLLFINESGRVRAVDMQSGGERLIEGSAPMKILEGINDTILFCYRDKAVNACESVELKELIAGRAPLEEGASAEESPSLAA